MNRKFAIFNVSIGRFFQGFMGADIFWCNKAELSKMYIENEHYELLNSLERIVDNPKFANDLFEIKEYLYK